MGSPKTSDDGHGAALASPHGSAGGPRDGFPDDLSPFRRSPRGYVPRLENGRGASMKKQTSKGKTSKLRILPRKRTRSTGAKKKVKR